MRIGQELYMITAVTSRCDMPIPDWLLPLLKSPQIIAAFLTIATTILLRLMQPRPKVVWGTSHNFTFRLPTTNPPGGEFLLHTQAIFLQNIGFSPAEDVEVILNYKPENLSLWPQLNYSTDTNPEGRCIIKIKNLGGREFTSLEMLHSQGDMPTTLRVRTPRGECKQVPMAPMQVLSRWTRMTLILLMFLGAFTIFYWLAVAIAR
jgi:hypothetical protein